MFKKSLSLSVIVCFFLTTLTPYQAHAGTILNLPAPGTMVNLSPAYEPVIIKGLTVHKDNPFLFDFIVDIGQDKMSGEPLKKEGEKLIKYFLASLAIPDKDLWVNLSPYEKNRMIPEVLGQTDMGRDLLEEDYILKQITASLIYPEKQLGKNFWDTIYTKAQKMYGTTQIPVNTFNKVWIMADKAEVFEHNGSTGSPQANTAFVVDCHLKVMLEEDYLALQKHNNPTLSSNDIQNMSFPNVSVGNPGNAQTLDPRLKHSGVTDVSNLGSQIIREIVIPALEGEVNTGKNFANLRQIFNSVILASWYKKNLKEALLNQVYANKSKVKGIQRPQNLSFPNVSVGNPGHVISKDDVELIYDQYLKAYKKGAFNYIKEDVNTAGAMIPRKYFSGGEVPGKALNPDVITDLAMGSQKLDHAMLGVTKLIQFTTALVSQALARLTPKITPITPMVVNPNDYKLISTEFSRSKGTYFLSGKKVGNANLTVTWHPENNLTYIYFQGEVGTYSTTFVGHKVISWQEAINRINEAHARPNPAMGVRVEFKDHTSLREGQEVSFSKDGRWGRVEKITVFGRAAVLEVRPRGYEGDYSEGPLFFPVSLDDGWPSNVLGNPAMTAPAAAAHDHAMFASNAAVAPSDWRQLLFSKEEEGFEEIQGNDSIIARLKMFSEPLPLMLIKNPYEPGFLSIPMIRVTAFLENHEFVTLYVPKKSSPTKVFLDTEMTIEEQNIANTIKSFQKGDLNKQMAVASLIDVVRGVKGHMEMGWERSDLQKYWLLDENGDVPEIVRRVVLMLDAKAGVSVPANAAMTAQEIKKRIDAIEEQLRTETGSVKDSLQQELAFLRAEQIGKRPEQPPYDAAMVTHRERVKEIIDHGWIINGMAYNGDLTSPVHHRNQLIKYLEINEETQKRFDVLWDQWLTARSIAQAKNIKVPEIVMELFARRFLAIVTHGDIKELKIVQTIKKTSGYGETQTIDVTHEYEGPVGSGKIINPRSKQLIADLMEILGDWQEMLMTKRSERLAKIERGEIVPGGEGDIDMDEIIPDAYGGWATAKEIIEGTWQVEGLPDSLKEAGIILTGPWTEPMAISALSGRVLTETDRKLYDEVLTEMRRELPQTLKDALARVELRRPNSGRLLSQQQKENYIKRKLKEIQDRLAKTDKVVPVRIFADLQDAVEAHGDGKFHIPQVISNILNDNLKEYVSQAKGKTYVVPPRSEWPTVTVRIADMEMSNRHITYKGRPVPEFITSFVFGLEPNFETLQEHHQDIIFVVPKLESQEESLFTTLMFQEGKERLGVTNPIHGVLMNETIEATLKWKFMVWVGRKLWKMINDGRWDEGAAYMRMWWFWVKKVLGDLGKFTMWIDPMDPYARDNTQIYNYGGKPEGGMVTQLASEGNKDWEADKRAVTNIVVDKIYEWLLGYDNGWAASPSYIAPAQFIFQLKRDYRAVVRELPWNERVATLLKFPELPNTREGLYQDDYEMVTYLFGYRNTGAAVAIDNLNDGGRGMFDGATGKKTNYKGWMVYHSQQRLTATGEIIDHKMLEEIGAQVRNDKHNRWREFVPESEIEIAEYIKEALRKSRHMVLWEKVLMDHVIDERDPKVVKQMVDEWLEKYNAEQDRIFGVPANAAMVVNPDDYEVIGSEITPKESVYKLALKGEGTLAITLTISRGEANQFYIYFRPVDNPQNYSVALHASKTFSWQEAIAKINEAYAEGDAAMASGNRKLKIKRIKILLEQRGKLLKRRPSENDPKLKEWQKKFGELNDSIENLYRNKAMFSSTEKPWVQGGIDLNTSNGMQWKVSKDGTGVEMNVDPAMIARIEHEGIDWLSPEILKMTPITSIWPLVGLQAPAQEGRLAGV